MYMYMYMLVSGHFANTLTPAITMSHMMRDLQLQKADTHADAGAMTHACMHITELTWCLLAVRILRLLLGADPLVVGGPLVSV